MANARIGGISAFGSDARSDPLPMPEMLAEGGLTRRVPKGIDASDWWKRNLSVVHRRMTDAVGRMQQSDAQATRAWAVEARRPDVAGIRVTIGMPVYNGAAYIERALAAIVEQSHGNFTLIISDDASSQRQ